MAATSGRDESGSDLQPDDVASATFSTSFRGFDPGEVRAYLSRLAGELRSSQRRLKTISDKLEQVEEERVSEAAAAPIDNAVVEQQRMTEVLGAEAARVLSTAHDAAGDIRARAEVEAEEIRAAARDDAATARSDAETEAAGIVANADRLLVERSEEADTSAAQIIAQGEAEREDMRQEGRHMVSEARIVRQRILKDMAKRRNQGRVQLEQLRAGRDRLQDSYVVVRRTLEEVTTELSNVVDDARIAADRAGRQVDIDDLPSDESLEAEVVIARDAGLTVPPPDPRMDGETTNEFDRRLLAEAAEDTIVDDVDDPDEVGSFRVLDAGDDTLGTLDGVATGDVFGSETPEDGVDFRPGTDEQGRVFEGVRILGPAVRPLPGTVTSGDGRPPESADSDTPTVDVSSDSDVEAIVTSEDADVRAADGVTGEADSEDGELDDPPTWRDQAAEDLSASTEHAEHAEHAEHTDETRDDEPSPEPMIEADVAAEAVADVAAEADVAADDADTAAEAVADADAAEAVAIQAVDEPEAESAEQVEAVDEAEPDVVVVGEVIDSDVADTNGDSSKAVLDLVDEPVIDLRDSVRDQPDNPDPDVEQAASEGLVEAESEREIDSLFARLKQSSAEPDAEPARADRNGATSDDAIVAAADDDTDQGDTDDDVAAKRAGSVVAAPSVIPEHAARVEQAADGENSADEGQTGDVEQSEAAEKSAEGELDHQDRVMVVRRDAMVDVAVRDLARHLKRLLSDDQNELLELLRSAPTVSAGDLLGGDRSDRLDEIAHAELVSAFGSGASYARPTATTPDAGVSDLSRDLADQIDGFLNDRLTRAAEDTSGDSAALAERVRATYREVRTREINRASEHAVLSAFARGGRSVAGPDDVLRWVANDCGPDCLDNSLAGTIGSFDEFPTGHRAPPAHQGCRCLLVVVEH